MAAKHRAKWWIVTTHVLTTGFAMPFIATIVGAILCGLLGLGGSIPGYLFYLGFRAVGYIGGTYYSLAYLKKSAISSDWVGCTVPSIIGFVTFALLGLAASIIQVLYGSGLIYEVLGLVVFYVVVIAAFVKVTSDGFRALQNQAQSLVVG
jgi:hypothetical protein